MTKINYSFEQWCLDNNRQDILNRWDYKLNDKSPSEVGYKSNKKYWFKCPRGIHESQKRDIQYLASGRSNELYCKKCRSFAQFILDKYDESYLQELSEYNPDINLWDIAKGSFKKIEFVCYDNKNHKCRRTINSIRKNGCPFCSHRNYILKEDSLGYLYPKVFEIWSDQNRKNPFNYYPNSGEKVWWKCKDDIHEDYFRTIASSVALDSRCPKCSIENYQQPTGELAHAWKGGTTPKNKLIRTSNQYKKWRVDIYEKDNYTCQCCGVRGDKLNCHHILNFSDFEDKRFDENNGISLCVKCHDVTYPGSFHNIYGTLNNTPEQLEEYINNKRKQLGINIPFSIKRYQAGEILKPEKFKKAI